MKPSYSQPSMNHRLKAVVSASVITAFMAATPLIPTAHADFLVGGEDVSDCEVWQVPAEKMLYQTYRHCADAFLYLTRQYKLTSNPLYSQSKSRPGFSPSDNQLLNDGLIACSVFVLEGYSEKDAVTALGNFDDSLASGLGDPPAETLLGIATTTLCFANTRKQRG